MAIRRKPALANEPLRWLAANGADMAPLTGTDTKALLAIAACWDLFAYTRSPGVLRAIAGLLREMQPSTAPLTRDLIARSMDWGDRDRYWPQVWPALTTVAGYGATGTATLGEVKPDAE